MNAYRNNTTMLQMQGEKKRLLGNVPVVTMSVFVYFL